MVASGARFSDPFWSLMLIVFSTAAACKMSAVGKGGAQCLRLTLVAQVYHVLTCPEQDVNKSDTAPVMRCTLPMASTQKRRRFH